ALQAAADVVCTAKAMLDDAGRPLASFLFLGPPGVGKTQWAKSRAAYLFCDAERILSFDMNDFVSPSATALIVGTISRPHGPVLTDVALQRASGCPWDEPEKAQPVVGDAPRHGMGEGRLTDALARTAGFAYSMLILTTILGGKEARREAGFQPSETGESATSR